MTALLGLTARLQMATLCLVTDLHPAAGDVLDVVVAAVAGGVDMVQIRDSGVGHEALVEAVAGIADALAGSQALLGVHGEAGTVSGSRADVLHLSADGYAGPARTALGPHGLLGRSAHDPAQLARVTSDCDYVFIGPVWSGPVRGRGGGLEMVRRASVDCRDADDRPIPWFAAGGITARNVGQVLEAGARRIAVGRAVTAASDPGEVSRQIARTVGRAWLDDPLKGPVQPG
ncbi:thiamine phosphate synthase [Acidipropionibacterium virtanenii]|uniref:Thiamine-phosphate synthase n=1 Tax=Acidipropionibacterium virtanenii TaxID=2057246 RepID=A0A344UVC3_9ACTN|nr:thiamine phosphate synthase [Acidipropionibacterium virtanenii]AXE39221.1 Thiamine-phosphate synthase [Acidipropionibacterium virtanenii]